jgi:hypothetical protein
VEQSSRLGWASLSVAVVLVVVTVVVLFAGGYFTPAHSPSTAPPPLPRTYVNLTISYDNASGIANYTTSFITIVSHTLAVVTIRNYDPTPSPLLVPWDNRVIGTVGGNETLDCGGVVTHVSSLPADGISHTFTVLDAFYNISVPIPPATSPTVPCVVSFELTMDQADLTNWGCVADCDNGLMAAGRMYGVLLVTG